MKARKLLPALLISTIMVAALIPYGGVAEWAQTLVGGLIFAFALFVSISLPSGHQQEQRLSHRTKLVLGMLFAWIGIHTVLVHMGMLKIPATGNGPLLCAKIYIWIAYALLTWVVCRCCESRRFIKTLGVVIIIIGSAEAAFGIAALYNNPELYSRLGYRGRVVGTFSGSNTFGGFLTLTLLVSLSRTLTSVLHAVEHIRKRGSHILHTATREDYVLLGTAALIGATILQIVALLLSGSRGAMLSATPAVLILLPWFAFSKRGKQATQLTIPLAILITSIVILMGVGGTFALSIDRIQSLSNTPNEALSRLAIWKGTLDLIKTYPFGVGLGGFSAAFPSFQPEGFNVKRVYHAHNDYLELCAELGIPGLILLIIAFLSLIIAAGKPLLRQHPGNTIWIQRGALLALAAGLLHANVDFNLTSRPGVSVLFFILLGMALAKNQKTINTNKTRHTRRNRFGIAVALSVIIPLFIHQIRFTAATILMQQGFAALGGSASIYFWLPIHPPPADQAIAKLERAITLAPRYAPAYSLLARGRLQKHAIKENSFVNAMIEQGNTQPPDILKQQISIALRPEAHVAAEQAHNDLSTALSLAPDNIDALAQMARVLGQLSCIAKSKEAFNKTAQTLLETVARAHALAPNDVMVNSLLFDALKDATSSQYALNFPSLQAELKAQFLFRGLHAMQLSANEVKHVLTGFMQADVAPRYILDSNKLPLDVIWKVYQHYDKANDAPAALHALTALHEATERDDNSRLRFSKNVHKAQRARYRSLAVQQRCKWLLRTHQFSEYTRALSEREANLNAFISSQLNAPKGKNTTDSHFRFLALERLWNERGLDAEHTLEFYRLARQQGWDNRRLMTILYPIALFGVPSTETSKCLSDIEIPAAFRHRMDLQRLKQKLQHGNGEHAKLELETLQEEHPLDPDIPALLIKHAHTLELSTSERNTALRHLKEITPANYIGMQYLGTRCEFMGFTVDPNILKTVWRFTSFVPSDLQVRVIFKDESGKTHHTRTIEFSKNNTLSFGSGRPTPGTIFNIDFPLPASVSKSTRMIVGLRRKSTSRWVFSSENLPYCEMADWFSLFYRPHEFVDQIAPSPSILGAFGLNGIYTRPNFSHNLNSIFNSPHDYPLLGGERKTTSPPTWQPCLSVTGIVEKAVATARKAFDADPNRTMFSLGINDGQDWCECDACRELCLPEDRKQPARQRWWSEPYWTFVNRVALKIQKTHPKKRIGALAYSNVARPPSFKLADNITVSLCQDAGSHFDEREQIRDNEYLDGWVSVCSDVGLYGYAGLASWIFPRYCRDELAASIRYASEHGIKHFSIENTWVKWIDGPLPWIVEKLIENPQLNPLALQRQFCISAYGPAADTMNVYFDTLQKTWASATQGKGFDGLYNIEEQARRYPLDIRQKMKAYLEDAKSLAAGNDAVLSRIASVGDPLVVADAFATEHEIMQELRVPITSGESRLTTEASLSALGHAIQNRNHLLETLPESTWKSDIEKALSASPIERTIDRWDRKQDTLIMQVRQTIKRIRTVAGDGLPPAKTDNEAPKESP